MNSSNNSNPFINGSMQPFLLLHEIIIVSVLLPIFLLLYGIIVCIIIRHPSNFKHSYYIIVLGLAFSDMAMLLLTLYGFIYDAVGFAYLGNFLDTSLSFLLYWVFGWYSTQIYSMLLASNRFCAIIFFVQYKNIFTVKLSCYLVLANILCSSAIVSPLFAFTSFAYSPQWKVGFFTVGSKEVFDFLDFDAVFGYLVASYVMMLYGIAVLYSLFKLKFSSNFRHSYIREVKLLFQGFTLGVVLCIVNFIHNMSPPASLNRIVTLLYSGINPVIYLISDVNLRQIFLQLFTNFKNSVYPYSTNNNVEVVELNKQ